MPQKGRSFRVGRVRVYLRGRVWYLCYYEHGKRRRTPAGPDRGAARLLAAQANAQLEAGAPSDGTTARRPLATPPGRLQILPGYDLDSRALQRGQDPAGLLLRPP